MVKRKTRPKTEKTNPAITYIFVILAGLFFFGGIYIMYTSWQGEQPQLTPTPTEKTAQKPNMISTPQQATTIKGIVKTDLTPRPTPIPKEVVTAKAPTDVENKVFDVTWHYTKKNTIKPHVGMTPTYQEITLDTEIKNGVI